MKEPLLNRFEKNIEMIPECGCWIWMGFYRNGRYGGFQKSKHKCISAHRFSYELYKHPIPKGMNVLHRCDTPSCVNPNHLFLGTQKDNMHDCLKKNRNSETQGEKNGKAKLNTSDVLKIREDIRPKKIIATEFGVSINLISKIKNNQLWKHI